mgnify:CR=1 FL=1
MTEEIRLAFAHPLERAQASAEGKYDRISLRDHIVEVEIGAFQSERGVTQRVCFNVVVEVRPTAEYSDDVDQILSYDRVTEAIAAELNFEPTVERGRRSAIAVSVGKGECDGRRVVEG